MNRYQAPETILDELGITEPSEIDIEAIAFHCNATVRYRHLDGCAARIIGTEQSAIITIDEDSSSERQRFSIGHELGHWMRDRGKAYICQKNDLHSTWGYRTDPESKANEYSANLLMPKKMFARVARNMPMTFQSVDELSSIFQTSLTATAIRLVELGSFPAALVCHGIKKRLWYSLGDSVPANLRPTRELSRYTDAFEVLFKGGRSPKSVQIDADEWIDHADSHKYTVYENSIKIRSDAVLTLLWWKDESQLLDIDEGW